jgi:hypothetical protein
LRVISKLPAQDAVGVLCTKVPPTFQLLTRAGSVKT